MAKGKVMRIKNLGIKFNNYLIILIIMGFLLGILFPLRLIFYILLFIVAISLAIFIFFRPFIGLSIIIFLIPFHKYIPKMPGFESTPIDSFIQLIILLRLIIDLILKKRKITECQQNKLLIGFFLIALLSLIFAKNISAGFRGIYALVSFYIFYFLIINFTDSNKKLKKLIIIALISALISCLFGFYYLYTGNVERDGGIKSPYGDTNDTAAFLITLMPLSFIFIKNEDKIHKKAFFSIIFLIMTIISILTFSIGGIIGLGVIFFMIFMESKKKALLISLFIITALIFSILYIPNLIYKQADETIDPSNPAGKGFVGTIETRADVLISGTKMFADNFVMGVGINNFEISIMKYAPKESFGWGKQTIAAHNMYLQVAAELGIFGILIFLGLFYSIIKELLNINKKSKNNETTNISKGIIISIIGLMTVGLFLSIAYYQFIWLIMSLSTTFIKINETKK
jgi:O-antigen ligase